MNTEIKNKILACIIHTQKFIERYDNIVKTWGKNIDFLFYSDYEDSSKKILKMSNKLDYSSGQEKQVNIINNLPEIYLNYDWYFFCDDDTFLNVKKLNHIINNLDENIVYGEIRNSWVGDLSLFYPLGGAGFLISKKILNLIRGNFLDNSHLGVVNGDVSLGLNLRRLNITMSTIKYDEIKTKEGQLNGCPLLNSQQPNFYGIDDSEVYKYISFHYIKNYEHMKKLHDICMTI